MYLYTYPFVTNSYGKPVKMLPGRGNTRALAWERKLSFPFWSPYAPGLLHSMVPGGLDVVNDAVNAIHFGYDTLSHELREVIN